MEKARNLRRLLDTWRVKAAAARDKRMSSLATRPPRADAGRLFIMRRPLFLFLSPPADLITNLIYYHEWNCPSPKLFPVLIRENERRAVIVASSTNLSIKASKEEASSSLSPPPLKEHSSLWRSFVYKTPTTIIVGNLSERSAASHRAILFPSVIGNCSFLMRRAFSCSFATVSSRCSDLSWFVCRNVESRSYIFPKVTFLEVQPAPPLRPKPRNNVLHFNSRLCCVLTLSTFCP